MGRQREHLAMPVVVTELLAQGAGIGLKPEIGGLGGLQGLALQGAAAEAVDRGDIGAIEVLQGQQELPPQPIPLLQILGKTSQPASQGRIRSGCRPIGVGSGDGDGDGGGVWHGQQGWSEAAQSLLQAAGNAIAQFRSRRIGEGHHQQLAQTQIAPLSWLGDQPQHQMGQGEGLAGAGAGLQQPHPGLQGKAIGVEGWQGAFGHLPRKGRKPIRHRGHPIQVR